MKDVALKLLDFKDINYDYITEDNNTALILACKNEIKEVALKILSFKDIKPSFYNQVNNDNNSALILAC